MVVMVMVMVMVVVVPVSVVVVVVVVAAAAAVAAIKTTSHLETGVEATSETSCISIIPQTTGMSNVIFL
jgi:hypothetical protein